jgi:hypothetical protein
MMPPPTERKSMGQIDVTSKSRMKQRAGGVKARIENFLRTFEWTWTSAVTFALVLVFFLLISTSIMPSFWMYYAEQKIGWAGPTDVEAFLRVPFGTGITNPLSPQGYLMVRDAIAMGLTTLPFVLVLVVSAALQNWRKKLRGGESGARPTGGYR